MNKTVSIALAGFSFVIEEQAYIKLNDYLQALRRALEKEEEEEVMYDIEIRVAEIFKERTEKREVVTDDDVEAVITQIGRPETIEQQEESYYKETPKPNFQRTQERKQLFRDTSQGKLGGVCAGLAHYIGMDIAIMRVIWVAAFFITGFFPMSVVYIILWVVMPEASSASDFLKMKGKPIDFEHIKEESVKFANESSRKVGEFYNENKANIRQTGEGIWKIIRNILGFIFAFLTFKFLVAGVLVLLGISLDTHGFNVHGIDELDFIFDPEQRILVKSIMGIAVLMFILLFMGLSIKCFSPKTKVKSFIISAGLLFVLLIGVSVYFGVNMAQQEMVSSQHEEENVSLNLSGDVIELDLKRIVIGENFKAYGREIFHDGKRVFERDRPDVYITRRDDIKTPYMVVKKQAKGYNIPMRINIPIEINRGRVFLPNYINYPYEHRFRDYDVVYELVLPRAVKVIDASRGQIDLEQGNAEPIDTIDNISNIPSESQSPPMEKDSIAPVR